MYHVLIVDDEFLVRLGLKTTIDWEAHGYKVAGEASNGKEALEMVRSSLPDIVLVDVKMPLMDGLEFITEAKKISETLSFIILSNYENFQYAKRAMKLGVSQYLLKSEINEDTLLATLESVGAQRSSRHVLQQDDRQARKAYLTNNVSKAQINACIPIDRMDAPPEGLFGAEGYVVIKYFCSIGLLNEQSIDMLSKTMVSLVEEEFPKVVYGESIYQMHYYITLICPVNPFADTNKTCIEKSILIGRKIKYYFSVFLKGGISRKDRAAHLPRLLREAEIARQQCFFDGSKTDGALTGMHSEKEHSYIVYNETFEENQKKEARPHVSSSKILGLLTEGKSQELSTYIHDVFIGVKDQGSYTGVEHTFIDFLSIAKSSVERLNIPITENFASKLDYDNWNILTSAGETEVYIHDIFNGILDFMSRGISGYSASVKKALAYVEEHYASNFTLEDVAHCGEISKSYLSMLFKQETGINFVTYLNQYRIKKGKKLLTDTNLKIYEIAEEIGFGSPYYFSRVFKEVTGMQCKEYRDYYSVAN
ncbi:response regulator transcription factor [Clostridium sp. C105KSO13]|uniref:response regulator transcription factor n=1 Tax=Clostridium sp. C105KSO13 TaxID=1776045 RepID=UPI00074076C3|nr:response regulator [Clostridium sp. C105KSO13]CUX29707.1 HTH-type transcriptional regulator YesS [Clostridium sp. C105KSO13]